MFAAGEPLPEVIDLHVTVLCGDVGQHRGKNGARCGGVNQLEEPDFRFHHGAIRERDRGGQLQHLPGRHDRLGD